MPGQKRAYLTAKGDIVNNNRWKLAAALMLSLSACAAPKPAVPAGPTEVHVALSDFTITLDKATIPAGEVKFTIDNGGKQQHEMVIEAIDAVDKAFEADGKTAEASDIEPGKTAIVTWKLDKPGKYRIACHKNANNVDHFASGMKTEIEVK